MTKKKHGLCFCVGALAATASGVYTPMKYDEKTDEYVSCSLNDKEAELVDSNDFRRAFEAFERAAKRFAKAVGVDFDVDCSDPMSTFANFNDGNDVKFDNVVAALTAAIKGKKYITKGGATA